MATHSGFSFHIPLATQGWGQGQGCLPPAPPHHLLPRDAAHPSLVTLKNKYNLYPIAV